MDQELETVAEKIRSLEIQGATDTAIAVFKALGEFEERLETGSLDISEAKVLLSQAGQYLANVRPTEPMARNGVRYILKEVKQSVSIDELGSMLHACVDYLVTEIENAKPEIAKAGQALLDSASIVLSHCHSSTVVETIIGLYKRNPTLRVITTETRPRYQGRITAKKLLEAGIDVTMIVDSAAASFIVDDSFMPVDAVLIGCDEFTSQGDAINKIGSLGLALAARQANKPIYVATPLLKAGTETLLSKPHIEKRPAVEVWREAPKELTIINPAFELVDHDLITAYITEAGVIPPSEVFQTSKQTYSWL